MKNAQQLERYFKGAANYRRIEILRFVNKHPGIDLDGIAGGLNGNPKTLSEHTKRLVHAGLLNKTYRGRRVEHSLSPYGKKFLAFMSTF